MARLRDPQGGCPWDLQQDFSTIAPYTVEEAYEVADAIDRHDLADLRDELGDLLLQVVFHARMAEEQGAFDFGDVVASICAKMVRRHPHVFGDADAADAGAVSANWDAIKRAEREARARPTLPRWPALRAACRSGSVRRNCNRAQRSGFDWPDAAGVLAKLREETAEVEAEFARGDVADNHARLEDEIGDVLFVCTSLARHAKVDVGAALRRANHKFERRFRAMEALAERAGAPLSTLPLDAQDALWNRAKRDEPAVGE
jgi:ATP diphosphatase